MPSTRINIISIRTRSVTWPDSHTNFTRACSLTRVNEQALVTLVCESGQVTDLVLIEIIFILVDGIAVIDSQVFFRLKQPAIGTSNTGMQLVIGEKVEHQR